MTAPTPPSTPTLTYQPLPIAPEVLEDLRVRDDSGAAIRPYGHDPEGAPLRCCLRRAGRADLISLVSYAPLRRWAAAKGVAPGAYDEVGPVFIHTTRCPGPAPAAGHPFAETGATRVLRRYDRQGHIAGGALIHLPGDDDPAGAQAVLNDALRAAFSDPEVALVHVRAVEYGCFQYEVRRPPHEQL